MKLLLDSIRRHVAIAAMLGVLSPLAALAQSLPPTPPPPTVSVNASASTSVGNDRLQAWLRAEAENADATAAASQVNAAIAKGLARAKGTAGMTVATSGYSTQQIAERGRPTRWKVVQTIIVTSSDFAATVALLTRMQEQDGLLLSGMTFSLSPAAREQAERSLTQQAIRTWQMRAQQAASALGFESWRPGHVSVQASDAGRVYPMMRAAGAAMSAEMAPVNAEAGMTEVTVTVTGEAVADTAKYAR